MSWQRRPQRPDESWPSKEKTCKITKKQDKLRNKVACHPHNSLPWHEAAKNFQNKPNMNHKCDQEWIEDFQIRWIAAE